MSHKPTNRDSRRRESEMRQRIAQAFGDPPACTAVESSRILAEVQRRASSSGPRRSVGRPAGRWRYGRALPMAAAFALLVVAITVVVSAPDLLVPGSRLTPVALALEPISRPHTVMHYVIEATGYREETWVDYDSGTIRSEFKHGRWGESQLTEDGVRLEVEREDGKVIAASRTDAMDRPADSLGFEALRYRDLLHKGRATYEGDGVVDGTPTHRLILEGEYPAEGTRRVEVIDVRKADGLPVRVEVRNLTRENGQWALTDKQFTQFALIELLEASAPSADVFELALPAGVTVAERRTLDATEAAGFHALELVWLGDSFEGLPWWGSFDYERDEFNPEGRATTEYYDEPGSGVGSVELVISPARPKSEWLTWAGGEPYEWVTVAGRKSLSVRMGRTRVLVTRIGSSQVAISGPAALVRKAAEHLRPVEP